MAHLQYLIFNDENIPMPVSYSIELSDVEADSGGTTEAGTTQRDVVREGVVEIKGQLQCFKDVANETHELQEAFQDDREISEHGNNGNDINGNVYHRLFKQAGIGYLLRFAVGGVFHDEGILMNTVVIPDGIKTHERRWIFVLGQ